ncbi:MAG: hypothetical protein WCG03_09630 [Kiritimatiellales bacterium]
MKRTVWRVFRGLAVRIISYAIFLVAVSVMMLQGAHWSYGLSFYGENGLIEWTQIFFLVISIFSLWRAGALDKNRRTVMTVLVLLLAMVVVRENDKNFDIYLGRHTWKWFAWALTAAAAWVAYHNRNKFYISALHLTRQPSFGIMLTGALVVLIFSRLFGYGAFWRELLDDRRIAGEVKRIVEECTELSGYFFIMIGTFELLHETHIRKRCRSQNR